MSIQFVIHYFYLEKKSMTFGYYKTPLLSLYRCFLRPSNTLSTDTIFYFSNICYSKLKKSYVPAIALVPSQLLLFGPRIMLPLFIDHSP